MLNEAVFDPQIAYEVSIVLRRVLTCRLLLKGRKRRKAHGRESEEKAAKRGISPLIPF